MCRSTLSRLEHLPIILYQDYLLYIIRVSKLYCLDTIHFGLASWTFRGFELDNIDTFYLIVWKQTIIFIYRSKNDKWKNTIELYNILRPEYGTMKQLFFKIQKLFTVLKRRRNHNQKLRGRNKFRSRWWRVIRRRFAAELMTFWFPNQPSVNERVTRLLQVRGSDSTCNCWAASLMTSWVKCSVVAWWQF